MKTELVKNWMTRDVITAAPDTTLPDAEELLMEYNIRRLPVVKKGHLVGIVTIGDVRNAKPSGATTLSIWEMNYLLARLKLAEIMTPDPVTVSDYASIGEAARLMLKYKVSGLPVVDEYGTLVGIITESDIFRMVVQDWYATAAEAVLQP